MPFPERLRHFWRREANWIGEKEFTNSLVRTRERRRTYDLRYSPRAGVRFGAGVRRLGTNAFSGVPMASFSIILGQSFEAPEAPFLGRPDFVAEIVKRE